MVRTDLFPPVSERKTKLKDAMYLKWEDEWIHHKTCRLSKNFLPKPCPNKSKEILHLSRSQMRRLAEIITGQNNLNYVQSKIYPLDVSELCRFCEEENETFEHLINECPCFRIDRQRLFQDRLIENTLEWKPISLIQFSYIPSINEALSFD